jgi:twinkle protein
MTEFNFLEHRSCPKCGSKDNLSVYASPDGREKHYCESCGYRQGYGNKDGVVRFNLPEVTFKASQARNIDLATMRTYGVGVTDKDVVFPYYQDGVPIGAKLRSLTAKEFHWAGHNPNLQLFGANLYAKTRSKEVIITEGEFDALAAYEMTGILAVSIPNGAGGAAKAVKKNLEWLESFKKVYVCFDNDEPGQTATDEVMDILSVGIGYRVSLSLKDACEYSKDGLEREFKEAVYASVPKRLSAYYDKDKLSEKWLSFWSSNREGGVPTGIDEIDNLGVRLRQGEVTTLFANPAVGKSTLARQIAANWVTLGKKVLLVPFEELDIKYYAQTVSMCEHKKLLKDPPELGERLSLIDRYSDKLFLASLSVTTATKDLPRLLEYTCRSEDIDLIVFDNITKFTSCEQNQTQEIQAVMALLVKVAQDAHAHVIVVSHTTRDRSIKDGEAPNMYSGFNSGAIERFSDNVITMGRVPDSNVCQVAVRKERANNAVGETTIYYDPTTGTFQGVPNGSSNSEGSDLRLPLRGGDCDPVPETGTDSQPETSCPTPCDHHEGDEPRLRVQSEERQDNLCGSEGSATTGQRELPAQFGHRPTPVIEVRSTKSLRMLRPPRFYVDCRVDEDSWVRVDGLN